MNDSQVALLIWEDVGLESSSEVDHFRHSTGTIPNLSIAFSVLSCSPISVSQELRRSSSES